MLTFAPGSPAALSIPLLDSNGQLLTADAVSYRVTDQNGVELVALTALDMASGPIDTVEFTLSGTVNVLSEGVTRALRVVTFSITTESGPATVVYRYLVKAEDALKVMGNSFQSYDEALLRATEVPNMNAWDVASDDHRQAALIDAYRAICKLQFVYDFQSDQSHIRDKVWLPAALSDLTESQFLLMDVRFRNAVSLAQVVEADARLGGTDVSNLRREGLMSATVGEVSQMFRPSKPLALPVSHRALQILAGFISWSGRISR